MIDKSPIQSMNSSVVRTPLLHSIIANLFYSVFSLSDVHFLRLSFLLSRLYCHLQRLRMLILLTVNEIDLTKLERNLQCTSAHNHSINFNSMRLTRIIYNAFFVRGMWVILESNNFNVKDYIQSVMRYTS